MKNVSRYWIIFDWQLINMQIIFLFSVWSVWPNKGTCVSWPVEQALRILLDNCKHSTTIWSWAKQQDLQQLEVGVSDTCEGVRNELKLRDMSTCSDGTTGKLLIPQANVLLGCIIDAQAVLCISDCIWVSGMVRNLCAWTQHTYVIW